MGDAMDVNGEPVNLIQALHLSNSIITVDAPVRGQHNLLTGRERATSIGGI
jgi:hypothetical protein